MVIDIGGQDSKVIAVDASGLVAQFAMNDRCAAGTGKFLEVLARAVNVEIEEMGQMALAATESKRAATTALRVAPTSVYAAPAPVAVTAPSTTGVSPGKMGQFNAVVDEGRSLARQVIGSNNSSADVSMAKNYDKYLRTLKDSMRGVKSDRDADRLISQARQTKAYLVYLKH